MESLSLKLRVMINLGRVHLSSPSGKVMIKNVGIGEAGVKSMLNLFHHLVGAPIALTLSGKTNK